MVVLSINLTWERGPGTVSTLKGPENRNFYVKTLVYKRVRVRVWVRFWVRIQGSRSVLGSGFGFAVQGLGLGFRVRGLGSRFRFLIRVPVQGSASGSGQGLG